MGGAAHGDATQWQDASVVDVAAVVSDHHRHLVLQCANQPAKSKVRMHHIGVELSNGGFESTQVTQITVGTVSFNQEHLYVATGFLQGFRLFHDKRCHPLVISTNNNQNPHQYF